jgi:hypothetical protein
MRRFAWTLVLFSLPTGWGSSGVAGVVLAFNPPQFEWHHPSGSATPNHIWVTGDFWGQNFLATGLPSASQMSLTLFIDDNSLSSVPLNVAVNLNSTTLGGFLIPSGVAGPLVRNFIFPAVAGPNYRLEIDATNTIPSGLGSVSIAANGRSFALLESVPEPTALCIWSLVGVFMIGIGCWQRKRSV